MLPDRRQDEIRLIPCPKCGGQPVVLIVPSWQYGRLRVECSVCGHKGPTIDFDPSGALYQGIERRLLPGLGKARRDAAAAWNEGTCGSGGGASG